MLVIKQFIKPEAALRVLVWLIFLLKFERAFEAGF
jgi:hypothetical protein